MEKNTQKWIIKNLIPKGGLHYICSENEQNFYFCRARLINSFKDDKNIFCGEKVKDCPVIESFLNWDIFENSISMLSQSLRNYSDHGLMLVHSFEPNEKYTEDSVFNFVSNLYKLKKQCNWTILIFGYSGKNLSEGFISFESFKTAIGMGIEIKEKKLHIFKTLGKNTKKIFNLES